MPKAPHVDIRPTFLAIALLMLSAMSCETGGLYEQTVPFPKHAWASGQVPEFAFDITDTSSFHRIMFVLRHTDGYAFNNIWIGVESMSPGDSVFFQQRFDLPLTRGDRWSGSAMDDIREHRILMYREPVKFSRTGRYRVRLHQQMRQDPLQHVLNVGLRVEPVNR